MDLFRQIHKLQGDLVLDFFNQIILLTLKNN